MKDATGTTNSYAIMIYAFMLLCFYAIMLFFYYAIELLINYLHYSFYNFSFVLVLFIKDFLKKAVDFTTLSYQKALFFDCGPLAIHLRDRLDFKCIV